MKTFDTASAGYSRSAGKGAIDKQITEDAVAAKELAEKQVLALTDDLSRVRTTYAHESDVRNAEVNDLKVQLISAQKRADEAECERGGAKPRLQQF